MSLWKAIHNKHALRSGMAAAVMIGLFAVSGCGNGSDTKTAEVKENLRPYSIRQVVAEDNEHGRTVMWQLPDGKECTVEYRKKNGSDISSVKAAFDGYKGNSGIADSYIYTAHLEGLTPDTVYEYRMRSGNSVSPWYPLITDNGKSFKALITSDSQSADYSGWTELVQDAWKRNSNANLFIDLGDLVDNGQDENQWQTWFRSVKGMAEAISVVPAIGNHEAYSLDWKMALPERYLAHFDLPKNGDEAYKEHYYSFDYGDVHFTVLDTSLYEEKEWLPDMYEAEKVWVEKDLKNTKKKWKVVLMHKDPFQYGFASPDRPHRDTGFSDEGKEFMPIFDRNQVDLVLSAHLHTYRDRGHVADFKRDPKGPVYIILGLGGDVRYPGLWAEHPLDEYVAPQPETDNYLTMEANPDQIVVTGYLPDGTELHKTVVTKQEET